MYAVSLSLTVWILCLEVSFEDTEGWSVCYAEMACERGNTNVMLSEFERLCKNRHQADKPLWLILQFICLFFKAAYIIMMASSEFQASCYFCYLFYGLVSIPVSRWRALIWESYDPHKARLLSTRLYMWYWSLIFSSHGVIFSCYVEGFNKFARNYLWLLLSTSISLSCAGLSWENLSQ